MLHILLLTLSLQASASAPPAAAVKVDPAEATKLFAAMEGRWSCVGAFANGKPLAADMSFARTLDGRGLHYSHIDRAPSAYRQDAVWGVDKDSGQFASLAFTAFADPVPSVAMYIAESLASDSVRLVHQRLLSDPFAPNRFTYTVEGPNKLKMLWELRRGNADWKMGDYLNCDRAAPAKGRTKAK